MSNIERGDNDNNSRPRAESSVLNTRVHFPDFYRDNPILWFNVLEAQFQLLHINTDNRKYNFLIANLNYETQIEIEDVIINPPVDGKYDNVKTELISRFTALREQQICKLLEEQEISERKPSEFLSHLRSLVNTPGMDELVGPYWIKKLPSQYRFVTAPALVDFVLDDLAKVADRVHHVMPFGSLPKTGPGPGLDDSIDNSMFDFLDTMCRRMDWLKVKLHEAVRPGDKASDAPNSSSSSIASPILCWYHRKFGDSAKKCIKPCIFNDN